MSEREDASFGSGTGALESSASASGRNRVSAWRWLPLVLGCFFSPVAFSIALWSTGFGKGDYVWSRILLPVASLVMPWDIPPWCVVTTGLLEWPLYGLLISLTRMRWQVWAVLLVAHAALALTLFG